MPTHAPLAPADLLDRTEARRMRVSSEVEASRRAALGQFFTPAPIAELLAGMFEPCAGPARILDAGAGVGSLTAALVSRIAAEGWPVEIEGHAIEMDEDLLPALKETLGECEATIPSRSFEFRAGDFIEWGCDQLGLGLFDTTSARFDLAILNPPYRKLNAGSRERRLLSKVGIETTNLYAAFVAIALRLLAPGGQLVAITPRSFCNGPYFKAFRHEVLRDAALRRIHVFEARDKAFRDTEVLQENVVIHLVKGADQRDVVIASSVGSGSDDEPRERTVPFASVVHPTDPQQFVHIVADEAHSHVSTRIGGLGCGLADLDASVSTGRVVDFRARDHLRMNHDDETVPLLYPTHLRETRIRWPVPGGKKPNAIVASAETRSLLLPTGNYVLVKRFSAKEERRRIVASVLQDDDLPTSEIAIENHLNVFHRRNAGLPRDVAWGLATFLNSTIVDMFFRQFNGHTQVNATDLRSLRYPTVDQLAALGTAAPELESTQQAEVDALVDRLVPELAGP